MSCLAVSALFYSFRTDMPAKFVYALVGSLVVFGVAHLSYWVVTGVIDATVATTPPAPATPLAPVQNEPFSMELTIDKLGLSVAGIGALLFLHGQSRTAARAYQGQIEIEIWAGVLIFLAGVAIAVYGLARESR
jgi:hypothetical protein